MDTKDKLKINNWCSKSKLWTLYKASECKLESPKEDNTNEKEKENVLQMKQALSAIDQNDESVKENYWQYILVG